MLQSKWSQRVTVVWIILVDGFGGRFSGLYLFLAKPRSRQNLGSLTRNRTYAPLKWKHRVLATGLPGKSLATAISYKLIWAYEKATLDWILSTLFLILGILKEGPGKYICIYTRMQQLHRQTNTLSPEIYWKGDQFLIKFQTSICTQWYIFKEVNVY